MNRRDVLRNGFILTGLALPPVPTAQAVDYDTDPINRDCPVSAVTRGIWWPYSPEWALLAAINQYRADHGIRPMEMSRALAGSAHHHAYYMAHTNDVDHTLSGDEAWSQNIFDYGYPAKYALGENVAAGRMSAAGTLNLWKHSPPHNALLLDPTYGYAGVGRVYKADSVYRYHWCLDTGSGSFRTIHAYYQA